MQYPPHLGGVQKKAPTEAEANIALHNKGLSEPISRSRNQ